jgi:hypothetical protein
MWAQKIDESMNNYNLEQEQLDEYWGLMKSGVKPLDEKKQRKVVYMYCMLVKEGLDELGKDALKLVEQITIKHVSLKKCEAIQKKLQNRLSEEGDSPYSVLIWALQPNSNSYPTWYSAGIAGLNIVDLKIVTLPALTRLTKEALEAINNQ